MTNSKLLSFTFIATIIFSCTSPQIRLSHNFDHGSLGNMNELSSGYFKGTTSHWLKRDGIGDQYYWFYFRADQVKNKSLTFELNELIGVYRGNTHLVYTDYTQPVYSYDQENWKRIPDVAYDSATHTFVFQQVFDNEPVWIAYAHPYPYGQLEKLLMKVKDQQYAEQETLAQTVEGRGIEMITITDPDRSDEDKTTIFLMAVQHAGEDAGAYLMEGLIDYLISEDPGARQAREHFIYKIIPMMNPDGIYNGISRYNTAKEDLNNIWLDDTRAQPEVTGVKNWVERWYDSGHRIDLFIDIHNHTQFHTYHAFIFQDHSVDSLVTCMNRYWPIRIWHSEFEGSSCAWFFRQGIPAGTIELSQSRVDEGPYLTIEDYLNYGKGTVKGISDYFVKEEK
jgi:hypothetical protein